MIKTVVRDAPSDLRGDVRTVRSGLKTAFTVSACVFLAVAVVGCGNATVFNPAFVNTVSGGIVPVTPGPGANFILVRVLNSTNQVLEFIVTIEREIPVLDADGNAQRDQDGNFITNTDRESVRLNTGGTGNATELGILFPCDVSPVTKVGLGENLLPTDAAVFVGGGGAGGATGFGVPAGDLNPLDLFAGNFNCGDTIVFRAFVQTGKAGGIGLQSFLLPGFEQPSVFSGPDTFVNYERFLQTQLRENR